MYPYLVYKLCFDRQTDRHRRKLLRFNSTLYGTLKGSSMKKSPTSHFNNQIKSQFFFLLVVEKDSFKLLFIDFRIIIYSY